MANIWIGDFRTRQLQQYQDTISSSTDNIYFIEDTAEYDWFSTSIDSYLINMATNCTNIIIMLGFNDCLYSCAWKAFDIDAIAKNYADKINELIEQYPAKNFYICSVNHIKNAFPFSDYQSGAIPVKTLNDKIDRFNSAISDMCNGIFINSVNYLAATGFETYDGVRFTNATSESLNNFILKQTGGMSYTTFKQRKTVQDAPDPKDDSFFYWLRKSKGGCSKCIEVKSGSGCVLPNCVGYAWGRFMEIMQDAVLIDPDMEDTDIAENELDRGNAGKWYPRNIKSGAYEYGSTPRPGAVICWSRPGKAGHVAIVEEVSADGKIIVTSESGWREETAYNPKEHFWVRTRVFDKGNWREANTNGTPKSSWIDNYTFQGFIYNPAVTKSGAIQDYIKKEQVTSDASRGFKSGSAEMQTNARYICNYLSSKGWSLNAIAGILGNMQTESSINPARIEVRTGVESAPKDATAEDIKQYAYRYKASKGRFPGYGLVQWTGMYKKGVENIWENHKYIYWCANQNPPLDSADIDSQLARIIWEVEHHEQWIKKPSKGYDLSFNDFITSTESPYWLAGAFAFCYERPGSSTGSQQQQDGLRKKRGEQANYWYNFLKDFTVITEDQYVDTNTFKIDKYSTTSITASFMAKNCKKASYSLDGKTPKPIVLSSSSNIETFTVEGLVPNTVHTICLELTGEVDTNKSSNKLDFTTLQDFPKAVSNIKLEATDDLLPHASFKLIAKSLSDKDWGYWKKPNNGGYAVQLIVNGSVRAEEMVNSLPKTIDISDYFNYDKIKVGDTVQIGIRTWVLCDNEPLYDGDFAACSNPICMLKKPVTVYLNKA